MRWWKRRDNTVAVTAADVEAKLQMSHDLSKLRAANDALTKQNQDLRKEAHLERALERARCSSIVDSIVRNREDARRAIALIKKGWE
jgi:hypothetical protein